MVDYGCRIGDRVKIHTNCYVAQYTEIQDDAFLAPGVTVANDLYPGQEESARLMSGPLIGAGAQIGVNVTLLPFVRIGDGCLVGAGSVVTHDLPPGTVAFGNPARVTGTGRRPARHRRAGRARPGLRRALRRPREAGGRRVSSWQHGHALGARRSPPTAPAEDRRLVPDATPAAAPARRTPTRAYALGKRLLDVALAVVLLVLTSPILLVAAVLVRSTSPGPVLFRQTRVGRGGRALLHAEVPDHAHRHAATRRIATTSAGCWRARREAHDGLYKLEDDPRVTRVGAVLRRLSIDELPQLLNVLKGEMTLVGPRPALPFEAELFPAWAAPRYLVAPGLTGLWQVSGRNRLTMLEGLELDVAYVEQRGFLVDLRILLRTVPAVLGRGAR